MPTPRKYASDAERQKAFRERRQQAIAAERAAKGIPGPPVIYTMPGRARWLVLVEQARAALELVHREMEDYAGARSDRWQDSDRGAAFQDGFDTVAEALQAVEGIEL